MAKFWMEKDGEQGGEDFAAALAEARGLMSQSDGRVVSVDHRLLAAVFMVGAIFALGETESAEAEGRPFRLSDSNDNSAKHMMTIMLESDTFGRAVALQDDASIEEIAEGHGGKVQATKDMVRSMIEHGTGGKTYEDFEIATGKTIVDKLDYLTGMIGIFREEQNEEGDDA